jgi:hypothetical protein
VRAWRETPKALIARCRPAICWTSNDDGGSMSHDTLNRALRIMGCDTCAGGDHCARGFRSTASGLLNEEGAFEGDVMEETLARCVACSVRRWRATADEDGHYSLAIPL